MKFAMIIDGCVQRSYFIKDGKSYKIGKGKWKSKNRDKLFKP